MEGLKRVAEGLGKVLLIAMLIVIVLMLTIQKRRRGKHAKSFMRDMWRRVWPEERRRVKEWK
jgi:K+ transporter